MINTLCEHPRLVHHHEYSTCIYCESNVIRGETGSWIPAPPLQKKKDAKKKKAYWNHQDDDQE